MLLKIFKILLITLPALPITLLVLGELGLSDISKHYQ